MVVDGAPNESVDPEVEDGRTSGRTQRIPKGPGRVLEVLAAIALSPRPISAGAISSQLGIPRSTTSLLLRGLVERDAVSIEQPSGLYAPGPLLFRIGLALSSRNVAVKMSRHVLEQLAEDTGEMVYIGVRTGLTVVYLDYVEGGRDVHLAIHLGVPRPIHSTALGKLFLAHDPVLAERVVNTRHLPSITERTITDARSLAAALQRIRENGYSDSEGENVQGVMSLAAPIRDPNDSVIAGINISWLVAEGLEKKQRYVERLTAAARDIEDMLRSAAVR
jgi:DNA-binding IclR family transcriptional regulator